MIKTTNELRRGNYLVGSTGEWLKVSRIYDADHIGIGDGDPYTVTGEHPCLAPISLTPEILKINLGFEGDDSAQQGTSLTITIKGRIKIVFADGDYKCLSIYQDGKLIDFPSARVKFVHDIQNLYRVLSGEELPVKL